MDTFPVLLSASWFRKNWFAPNLTPAFGALKMSTGVNPVYSEKKPFCWIVYLKPEAMPVKGGGGPPLTVLKDWSCVFRYSMGQVQQHSMAPPTPPALRAIQVFFWAGGILFPHDATTGPDTTSTSNASCLHRWCRRLHEWLRAQVVAGLCGFVHEFRQRARELKIRTKIRASAP